MLLTPEQSPDGPPPIINRRSGDRTPFLNFIPSYLYLIFFKIIVLSILGLFLLELIFILFFKCPQY